jgi:UDP:flavonoid glycosyltransferase YjiC (YdhE family)
VRVLCTTVPSAGHLNPLLPLLRSLRAVGHEVTVASGHGAESAVETVGVQFIEAGLDEQEMVAQAADRLRDVAPSRRGIAMFGTIAAPALVEDLLTQLDRLAPDVVISEEGEWGGPVLAAMAGVPGVTHGWGAPLWSDDELEAIHSATTSLWRDHDVTPGTPAGIFDYLYLDGCPPILQTPRATRLIHHRRTMRFEPFDSGEAPPSWLETNGTRPLVYATLGTVPTFNTAPWLFAAVVRGLAGLSVQAVITVGRNNNPNDLNPLPENVHVEQHLSQVQVLRRSSLAITHGGAGSTLAALAFGLPLLVLPRGAPSQQRLAARCTELGAALMLNPDAVTPKAIGGAIERLLEDPAYRVSANRIRESIEAQPSIASVVPALETLTQSP